jgi:hypothetical protein
VLDKESITDPAKELGQRLREGRTAKGWTLRQAAAETGISNGYLSLIEQGEVKAPSPRYLMALAAGYELSYDELMALAGHPSGPVATAPGSLPTSGPHWTGPTRRTPAALKELGTRGWSGAGLSGVASGGRSAARADETGDVEIDEHTGRVVGDATFTPTPGPRRRRGGAATDDELTDAERQQLMALVLDDMRGLSAGDIANVRAFIAGIRATRRR